MTKKIYSYKNIKSCRICFSKKISNILNLGKQPLANSLRKNKKKNKIFPLKIVFCKDCKTIQLSSTINPKYLFLNYLWVTASSTAVIKYSKFFFKKMSKYFNKKSFVLEIASNDGTFLKLFKRRKIKVLGVDPAKNLAEKAKKNGVPTISKFFNKETSIYIKKKYGEPNLVIARNVIPHVENLHSIVNGINSISGPQTHIAIEFHYSKIILDELHYDSIYHEHIFYFSLKTIMNIFSKYDLYPFDVFKSPISGGSLVLLFSKKKVKFSKKLTEILKKENTKNINSLKSWKKFAFRVEEHKNRLIKTLKSYSGGKKVIIYGASARGSTMLNFLNLDDSNLEYIIDINEMKQDLYSPGPNVIIKNPKILKENKTKKIILLLAWNFLSEIRKYLYKNNIKCSLIVPFPKKIKIYEIH